MATKKLTERQRFERWYMRRYGLRRMPTEDHDMLAYWDMIGQWAAWLASARAKR